MKTKHYYLPLEQRVPDTQYRNLLNTILNEGEKMMPIHGAPAWRLEGYKMVFDMENGFPIITERDMSRNAMGAIGEIIGFINGAETIDELEKFGCPRVFWEETVTEKKCADFGLEPGHLGPGSYGPSFTSVPTPYGKPFNQIDNLVNQIKKMPHLRTHLVNPWIAYYTCAGNDEFPRKVVTAPCHGWLQVMVYPENGTFTLHHTQRSGDCPVGVPGNIAQYAAFGLKLERVLGYQYKFKRYIHYIIDAHIYEPQLEYVYELLKDEPRIFPTLDLIEHAPTERLQDFRREHFLLSEYNPHIRSFKRIPTIA